MRKKYIIISLAIACILAGIIIGILLFNRNNTTNLKPESGTRLAQNTVNMKNEIEIIQTANSQIQTSPNCLFVFETYYKECGHTAIQREDIAKGCVNQTEEDLQEKYKEFKIKEFTAMQVTFYTEKAGICDEHYIVKENNGYVAIYTEDSLGKEILKETTEIVTAYLPETDLVRLREGIKVIGKENLNAIIEDYE